MDFLRWPGSRHWERLMMASFLVVVDTSYCSPLLRNYLTMPEKQYQKQIPTLFAAKAMTRHSP